MVIHTQIPVSVYDPHFKGCGRYGSSDTELHPSFPFFCSGTNELNVMATPSLARKTADMTRDLASPHDFLQILFLWTFELSQA